MRYLGLDLGSRTLGIAVSETGLIASNYKTIRHEEEYDRLNLDHFVLNANNSGEILNQFYGLGVCEMHPYRGCIYGNGYTLNVNLNFPDSYMMGIIFNRYKICW